MNEGASASTCQPQQITGTRQNNGEFSRLAWVTAEALHVHAFTCTPSCACQHQVTFEQRHHGNRHSREDTSRKPHTHNSPSEPVRHLVCVCVDVHVCVFVCLQMRSSPPPSCRSLTFVRVRRQPILTSSEQEQLMKEREKREGGERGEREQEDGENAGTPTSSHL